LHIGKIGSEKHNERDFDYIRNADHIDPNRTKLNTYVSFCPGKGTEIEFYAERYQPSLDFQNARHAKKGNYNRIKKMQEVYNNKQKRPTEEIIQYSKEGEEILEKDEFDLIIDSYIKKLQLWSREHGSHFHILKYSVHYDEGTPHAHIRTIWDYIDENGLISIGQDAGMKQAGLDVDDPLKLEKDLIKAEKIKEEAEAKKGKNQISDEEYKKELKKYISAQKNAHRFNNRSIKWTRIEREIWESTLEEYGHEVDRERSTKAEHQTKAQHLEKMKKLEDELRSEKRKYENLVDDLDILISTRAKELANLEIDHIKEKAIAAAKEEFREEKKKNDKIIALQNKKIDENYRTLRAQDLSMEIDESEKINKELLRFPEISQFL